MSRHRSFTFAALALALVLALTAAACSSDDGAGGADDEAAPVSLEDAAPLDVGRQGGVEYVMVSEAEPGTELSAGELLARVEEIHRLFDDKKISFEDFEEQKADYTQLCVDLIITPDEAEAAAARARIDAGESFENE
mgnify:CR=1 FL=1